MTDLQTELSNTAELLAASTEARRLAGGTGQMTLIYLIEFLLPVAGSFLLQYNPTVMGIYIYFPKVLPSQQFFSIHADDK